MDELTVDDILEHFGVPGMRWGVRKSEDGGGRDHNAPLTFEPGINRNTKAAVTDVTSLMHERYGQSIKTVKLIGPGNPEYPDMAAYVTRTPGKNTGIFHIQGGDLTKRLGIEGEAGWMRPETATLKGLVTHESAHSLFHAEEKNKQGFLGPKVVSPTTDARTTAMRAALKAAKKNRESIWGVSGYANASHTREELEAELFANYHWTKNPPDYVKVWGETLHKEMNVDPTPFREAVKK